MQWRKIPDPGLKAGGKLGIVFALIIFSLVVFIHELGHFLLAKWNHIVVEEFSIGMGPRIASFEKGGTRYSIKALPIGGSCAMMGEDLEDRRPGSFQSASVWGRISVVAAGPVFNFLLAFVLSVIIVGFVGSDSPKVLEVEENSNAEAAGLKVGDIIESFNGYHVDLGKDLYVYTYLNELKVDEQVDMTVLRDGEKVELTFVLDTNERYLLGLNRSGDGTMTVASLIPGLPLEDAGLQAGDVITSIDGQKVANSDEYDAYIEEHPLGDQSVDITYMRDGLEYEATIVPAVYKSPSLGFYYNVGAEKVGTSKVLKYGFYEVKYMVRSTILSLRELVRGGLGMNDLSGPIGVVDAIGDTYEASKSEGALITWMNMLNMAVLLSANLGVMNLLPLPALDGGRLVFLIIEAIRRKRGNQKIEGAVHFAGFVLLMALMVFIVYSDIMKLI
ncbi:MAG: RIP metalloprotease RseP [Eubacteriales bacterium]|nr:RIP metalloprotease RseP [Eubacteriales bacterium]